METVFTFIGLMAVIIFCLYGPLSALEDSGPDE